MPQEIVLFLSVVKVYGTSLKKQCQSQVYKNLCNAGLPEMVDSQIWNAILMLKQIRHNDWLHAANLKNNAPGINESHSRRVQLAKTYTQCLV